jgi:CHAD domain-containing protein
MTAADNRADLLRHRLERFRRLLHGVQRGNVRAVHRARVASRRLRELLPILQLDPDVARKLRRRLRRVTARLGPVRELDVLMLLIDELTLSRPQHSDALSRVAMAVSAARDEAHDQLTIGSMRRATERLEDIADTLAHGGRSPAHASAARRTAESAKAAAWRWVIAARVAHRASRLSVAIRDAGAVYLPERLHTVRIALKKLRYAVELSAESTGTKDAPDLRALKRAQEILGRMHDFQILIDRVRQVQATLVPPRLATWRALDALVTSLDEDCRVLHGRYMRTRSRLETIAERLSGGRGHASAGGHHNLALGIPARRAQTRQAG